MAPDTGADISALSNATWWVRHYNLQRTGWMREQRAQAILRLGLTVREIFNRSDDFEPLLAALVDGLRPRDDPPF